MPEQITYQAALQLDHTLFVDVRSPKEFQEDHLPAAINIPLLDDQERAVVGTLYKQVSQRAAFEKGAEYYKKRLPSIIKAIKKHADKYFLVYCWRGGMRSKIIATLFQTLGYKTKQLTGGYKVYRQYVIKQLTNFKLKPKLVVLHGLTCTGKTQLLQEFPNSLDLEGLAQHRGSLYGALSLKPNSQKRFESLLLRRLNQLNSEKLILVEGESRKIGDVQIPEFFWKAMKKSIHVYVQRDLNIRTKEMVQEYFLPENIEEIKKITTTLKKVISNKNKQKIIDLINDKKYTQAGEIFLEHYYDPLYNHSLKEINYAFTIINNNLQEAVKELKTKLKQLTL